MRSKWISLIIKRRKVVFGSWLLVIFLGILGGSHLGPHLTTSLVVPNTPSARADSILSKRFNENIEGTFTVIYHFKNASALLLNRYESGIKAASLVIPGAVITQEKALGGTLVASINTPLSLSVASGYTENFRHALVLVGLKGALVTGPPAIESDVTPVLSSDLHKGEIVGLLIALILLLLILGFSREILIPFIFAASSISATIGLIFLIAQKFLVVLYIPNIVELIGLGLAIDYSLLLLFRFRSEIADLPEDIEAAILRTMKSAGKTVAISALTVTIALSTLSLVPIPFVRSLGFASALVPLISLLTAFTLQPALLYTLSGKGRGINKAVPSFNPLAEFIVRKPMVIAVSSLVVLGALGFSALSLHLTPSSLTAIPDQLESQRAIALATSALGPGVITPSEMVVDLGEKSLGSNPGVVRARSALSSQLLKDPEVAIVAGGMQPPYVDSSGRYIRIFVIGHHSFGDPQSRQLVAKLRALDLSTYGFPANSKFYVGGAAAQGVDLLHVLSRTFPWVVVLALLLTFTLLLQAFKSLVLPLKAIALDLISLTVAYGIVVIAFGNHFISRALGIYQLNQIEAWAVVFLFVLLFGVSMDYEVFMISRIKEAKDRGLTNSESIVEGLTQTGAVVTTAALIFIGAVSGLALGHFAGLQEIGIGLGFGVLIDATIVRGMLLPSVMVLLGRWNWWLPSIVAKQKETSPIPLNEVRG